MTIGKLAKKRAPKTRMSAKVRMKMETRMMTTRTIKQTVLQKRKKRQRAHALEQSIVSSS